MKIWTLTISLVRDLEHYTCYCEKNPAELLQEDPEYIEVWQVIVDDLFNQYSHLIDWREYSDDNDEDEMSEDEILKLDEEIWEMAYSDFCNDLTFTAYEVNEPEDFDILIDEREDGDISD